MDETTTRKLEEVLSRIDNTKDMETFMAQPKVVDSFKSLPEFYRSLPQVQEASDSLLIEKSGIERSYYYQIMKGTKHPSRDKVIRLILGGGLSLKEATRALELSGNAPLYPKSRRDIIITVAINQSASVVDTNLLLDKYGEKPLD